MTNEPSPRPWRVEENSLGWKTCIVDANGNDVASCWGGEGINSAEPAQADAALIVDAVNERDRIRAELAAAGELLQCWLAEAPGDPETHEWLSRNGFKDPYPECWERAEDDAAAMSKVKALPAIGEDQP